MKYLLEDVKKASSQNLFKVVSLFAGGGGSSTGYRLAGGNVLAINEFIEAAQDAYHKNYPETYIFKQDIRKLTGEQILSKIGMKVGELDILDGSPPCASFSTAGLREKAWGKDKMFREGQARQVLDDLFFDFIDLVGRLKPKVVIAENVKGMLAGNAKGYVLEIKKQLQGLGYDVQIFLLNGATMGLPQMRQRVFVVCNRMGYPKLKLQFNDKPVYFKEIEELGVGKKITGKALLLWNKKRYKEKDLAEACIRETGKRAYFGTKIQYRDEVPFTLIASSSSPIVKADEPILLSKREICNINSSNTHPSFPCDKSMTKISHIISVNKPCFNIRFIISPSCV